MADAFFGAAFFAGAAGFLAGTFLAAACFAGAFLTAPPDCPARFFEVPAVLWEPLPDVREAMEARLPASAVRSTYGRGIGHHWSHASQGRRHHTRSGTTEAAPAPHPARRVGHGGDNPSKRGGPVGDDRPTVTVG
ncbi:hypothetical protein TPA0910_62400 [Streptomyces hygroscopicus subsp. sporocinereus]|uniref:Uncharacterized protein n=1 Tax=Streptomyces hygroscopicus TaxID=1912 RepID=A0ABQ3U873_STRHY|nr:hypothetical protein TPA0910_62400 [Streptomyces hygroscopicus]